MHGFVGLYKPHVIQRCVIIITFRISRRHAQPLHLNCRRYLAMGLFRLVYSQGDIDHQLLAFSADLCIFVVSLFRCFEMHRLLLTWCIDLAFSFFTLYKTFLLARCNMNNTQTHLSYREYNYAWMYGCKHVCLSVYLSVSL